MFFAPSSIGYYLHYSLTFHFIERKSIIHCTHIDGCFQASMIWRGGRGGGEWTTVQIVSVDATLSGSGVERKETVFLKRTHTHTDCILIILFPVCMSLSRFLFMQEPRLKELTSQVKQTQKVRKFIFTFSITCECLTYGSGILQSVSLLLKGLFQMRCQLSGLTYNWCQIKHNNQYLLLTPQTTSL